MERRVGRRKENEGDEGVRRDGQETRKEGESRRAGATCWEGAARAGREKALM